jgi:hypothetical protein
MLDTRSMYFARLGLWFRLAPLRLWLRLARVRGIRSKLAD